MFLHGSLIVTTFPISIQSNFTLILPLKRMAMSIAVGNYIGQYQQNFNYIEEREIAYWYRGDFALYLNNTKKVIFCSIIEPIQV